MATNRVTNAQILEALNGLTTAITGMVANMQPNVTQRTVATEPNDEPSPKGSTELDQVCAKYKLDKVATERTIAKFHSWCADRNVASGTYRLYVLVNREGGRSLRWFRKAPSNAAGVIATS